MISTSHKLQRYDKIRTSQHQYRKNDNTSA